MKKPGFFIVGAAKSGTTSLWQYLRNHPQVFMPGSELLKEPGYFSDLFNRMSMEQYLDIFREAGNDHLAVGEASNVYLSDPSSAGNIQRFDSKSKIIILLRNPADR